MGGKQDTINRDIERRVGLPAGSLAKAASLAEAPTPEEPAAASEHETITRRVLGSIGIAEKEIAKAVRLGTRKKRRGASSESIAALSARVDASLKRAAKDDKESDDGDSDDGDSDDGDRDPEKPSDDGDDYTEGSASDDGDGSDDGSDDGDSDDGDSDDGEDKAPPPPPKKKKSRKAATLPSGGVLVDRIRASWGQGSMTERRETIMRDTDCTRDEYHAAYAFVQAERRLRKVG